MSVRSASLGQLAVACRLISDVEHVRLRRVLQVRAREGRAVSFAKLLIKAGFGSKTVRRLLRLGSDLAGVRCDGCEQEVPSERLPDRREVPCERCGALLLGFGAFRRRDVNLAASSLASSAGHHPLLDLSAALDALEARGAGPRTPSRAEEEEDAPVGTVMFTNVLDLPRQAAPDVTTLPFTDVLSVPTTGRPPRSEEETLVAFKTLLAEPPRRQPPPPVTVPSRPATARVSLKDPLIPRGAPVPEPGQVMAGWRIKKELGEGGVGKVFLAEREGRLVALKVLKAEVLSDQEYVARFRREAEAAGRIRHPNVVGLVEAGRDPASGLEFIAFEFVEGGSLLDRLAERGRLDEREALSVARGIALALAEAESQRIVHRDVKPENILLTRDGTAKLADLGLIRQLGRKSLRLTAPGIVVGTPCYMAPEQALGEDGLDVRADIYGLGLCVWQSLTGTVPFDEEDELPALELMTRHIEEDVPDVRIERPTIGDATAQVVRHMTARRKEDRYPSPAELVRDIELVLAGRLPLGPREVAAPIGPVTPTGPSGPAFDASSSSATTAALPSPAAVAQVRTSDVRTSDVRTSDARTSDVRVGGSSADRAGVADPPSARRRRPDAPVPGSGADRAGSGPDRSGARPGGDRATGRPLATPTQPGPAVAPAMAGSGSGARTHGQPGAAPRSHPQDLEPTVVLPPGTMLPVLPASAPPAPAPTPAAASTGAGSALLLVVVLLLLAAACVVTALVAWTRFRG
jgi:serine/threonine protein kinase